jgi:hypothetical protein
MSSFDPHVTTPALTLAFTFALGGVPLAISETDAIPNGAVMSRLRLSIAMSLDGYVAGPDQNAENPVGAGGLDLHGWFFPLTAFREMHGP